MDSFPYQDLPINYSQIYQPQDVQDQSAGGQGGTSGGGLSSGQVTPRRSLSQTILSQMQSPTAGFGLTARSPSPSPLLSSAIRRAPSLNRGGGFMSRGPSLQELLKSFINRVSRGTQTDSDDNFDNVSIASVQSGFSALANANDLSQSRLKLFLNDNHQLPVSHTPNKSYASSHVDENEFVEELQKLRDEINGEFGPGSDQNQPEEQFSENQFDLDDLDQDSVYERKSFKPELQSIPPPLPLVAKPETKDQSSATEHKENREGSTQTEPPKPEPKVLKVEIETQTDPEPEPEKPEIIQPEPQIVIQQLDLVKPETRNSETQTNLLRFCDHCAGVQLQQARESRVIQEPQQIIIQQQPCPPQPPQIMKCEFLISHADIICKDNKMINRRESSSDHPKPTKVSVAAQVNIVGGTLPDFVQPEIPLIDETPEEEKSSPLGSEQKQEPEIVIEDIVELKVANLETERKVENGHQNGSQKVNFELNGVHCTAPITEQDEPNGDLPNGTPGNKKSKKKQKKDKEEKIKTPKKSPRKLFAIIPSTTDEEDAERDKRHEVALMTVRPKCCTIS